MRRWGVIPGPISGRTLSTGIAPTATLLLGIGASSLTERYASSLVWCGLLAGLPRRLFDVMEGAARYIKPVEPKPEQVPDVGGVAWCSKCDRDTERASLPGTSTTFGPIPTWWFCTFCGVVDFDYEPGEAA